MFPVLKSNAYGHGLKEVCKILEKTNAKMLAVDSFPEAQIVYKYSKKKVLVIGECAKGQYKYFNFKRTEFCVYNIETLKHLASFRKNIKVHIFLNTGMNREGVKDLDAFLAEAKKYLSYIDVTGVCSHLASSEEDSILNQKQLDSFFEGVERLKSLKIFPKWIHLGNSGAVFKIHDSRLTAFRPGLSLYGYHAFTKAEAEKLLADGLRPALRLISHVVSMSDVKQGEIVSYNETYVFNKDSRICVVPFGYAEGLSRSLSSKAIFTNKTGDHFPLRGRVCMNLSCLEDETQNLKLEDEIVLISEDSSQPNSVYKLAEIEKTIPYLITTRLNSNIRRIIV